MAWEWPESVVQEVAERRAAFVVGAGASMACATAAGQRPPSWVQLLTKLKDAMVDAPAKKAVSSNLKNGRLLEAAEIIQDILPPNEMARILRNELQTPKYLPSEIHKTLVQIDPKIIITTNYDDILDNLVMQEPMRGAYAICKPNDGHAVNDLRSGQRCIFKMHGCITDPSKIVLSKTSYFRARRDNASFYNVLDSIFLINTLIFIGTSMEDPDLQLILESANISAPSDYPHYAIMEKPKHAVTKKILKENYNVVVVEYPVGKHKNVVDMLSALVTKVEEWRSLH